MAEQELGPTGEFPDGKLGPEDEGEIALEVSHGAGVVKIDFGTKVRWIALPAGEALGFAQLIAVHAGQAYAAIEEQQKRSIVGPDGKPS